MNTLIEFRAPTAGPIISGPSPFASTCLLTTSAMLSGVRFLAMSKVITCHPAIGTSSSSINNVGSFNNDKKVVASSSNNTRSFNNHKKMIVRVRVTVEPVKQVKHSLPMRGPVEVSQHGEP